MSEKSVGRFEEIENRETRDLDCHQLELSQKYTFSQDVRPWEKSNIRGTFIIEFAKCNDFSTGDPVKLL